MQIKGFLKTRKGKAGLGLLASVGVVAIAAFAALPAFGVTLKVLGAAAPATPSCPLSKGSSQCFVEAKVTGFQLAIDGKKSPFVAPWKAKVVAWSIKLGKPSAKAERCLSEGCDIGADSRFEGFGGPAKARLSILKPINKSISKGKQDYVLVKQSPVEELKPFFGSTTTFTLHQPLLINKGYIAALTIPTWAPVFVGALPSGNTWRASRNPSNAKGGCTVGSGASASANVKAGSPVQKLGQQRRFTCSYKTNRLLYSASIVKAPGGF